MPLYGKSGYGRGRYGIADLGPIYSQPIGYYLNLITSQYRTSPKFMQWLQLALKPLADASFCVSSLTTSFDFDNAVGNQLDVLGALIGVGRTVGFQPTNNQNPTLDDDTYRLLLRARIGWNNWTGKIESLYPLWQSLFPSGKLIINDNQNMTATIIISGSFSSIILDLITNGYIIPRPEGVSYNYVTSTLPIFGADLNNSYIAGADLGHAAP